MEAVKVSTVEEFRKLPTAKVTVVDFYATWCGPCRMLGPKLDELAKEYAKNGADIKFIKIDIDDAQELADYYQVTAMPTILVFKDALEQPVKTVVGGAFERVRDAITAVLAA